MPSLAQEMVEAAGKRLSEEFEDGWSTLSTAIQDTYRNDARVTLIAGLTKARSAFAELEDARPACAIDDLIQALKEGE